MTMTAPLSTPTSSSGVPSVASASSASICAAQLGDPLADPLLGQQDLARGRPGCRRNPRRSLPLRRPVNSSRPPARTTLTPGRSTPPCPCQSITSRATASVCARVSVRPNSSSTARRMSRCTSAAGLAARAPTGRAMPPSASSARSGASSSASASSASASSCTWSAVRASASATPGPSRVLERRQRRRAAPAPACTRRTAFMRVVPTGRGPDPRRPARWSPGGRRAAAGGREARSSRMPGDGVRARAAGEPEQHRLRLVVEGVPEQDSGGARLGASPARRPRSGQHGPPPPGRRRRATPHPAHEHRVEPERRAPRSRPAAATSRGAGLHPVVDDDRADRARPARGPSNAAAARARASPARRRARRAPRSPSRHGAARPGPRSARRRPPGSGVADRASANVMAASRPPQQDEATMAEYDVIIEIPKGSRNKYEVDHVTGRVYLDRVLFTSLRLPDRLRLLREHARPRRRPGGRARAARVPGVPGRRREGAPGRRAEHERRGRLRRQGHRGAAQGPALAAHPGPRRRARSRPATRSSTSSAATRTSSPASS